MGSSHADKRKALIRKIGVTLAKLNRPLDKEDMETLIAMIGAEHGTARRTAREYIKSAEQLVNKGVFFNLTEEDLK